MSILGTTLTYVAPELLVGNGVSNQSDIYSFGMTLFETLSNISSPWEKCFSFFSDVIVKESLMKGMRPEIEFQVLYAENTTNLAVLIRDCWRQDALMRPSINQVNELYNNINLFTIIFIYM